MKVIKISLQEEIKGLLSCIIAWERIIDNSNDRFYFCNHLFTYLSVYTYVFV